jgi:hypothetical protein
MRYLPSAETIQDLVGRSAPVYLGELCRDSGRIAAAPSRCLALLPMSAIAQPWASMRSRCCVEPTAFRLPDGHSVLIMASTCDNSLVIDLYRGF